MRESVTNRNVRNKARHRLYIDFVTTLQIGISAGHVTVIKHWKT